MPHDFAKVIAELEAATANLKRSMKRSRAFIADRVPAEVASDAPPAPEPTAPDRGVFVWRGRHDA